MDDSFEEMQLLMNCGALITVLAYAVYLILYKEQNNVPREPSQIRDLYRNAHMYRILYGGRNNCIDYLRMDIRPFFNLARIIRQGGLLKDTINVSIEEQLAMFLHIMGHKSKNRVMKIHFIRSGETVSRYFNAALGAICSIRDHVVRQAGRDTPIEIANNPLYYPFFKDCIGLVDGTHIDATIPVDEVARFRGRKGTTQNVLAVATPDKRFTYVMAGWEGSANDFTILRDALSLPPPNGLRVIEGKYYLVDAGYTTMHGFIAPYRSVRYHLKEHTGRTPNNRKELFNLRHSSLRSKIESAFGILKNRFKILSAKPFHSFPSQVDIVLACFVLHNYILGVDPHDRFLNEDVQIQEEDGDVFDDPNDDVHDYTQAMSQRVQREENRKWVELRDNIARDMWINYCQIYRGGNIVETD